MSEENEEKAPTSLERVVRMAQLMVAAAERVDQLTEQLTVAKADLQRIEREELPTLMEELELTALKLEDGSTLEIKPDVICGITEANRARAHAWLIDNGFSGLIKSEVSVSFGREALDEARVLAEEIGGELKESVHPATLKSFVKEQMQHAADPDRAEAAKLPYDLFNVMPFNKAVLGAPKVPKKKKS